MDGFLSWARSTVTAVGEELKQQAALLADEGLGITYVTRNLLACGFPYDDSQRDGGATIALPVPADSQSVNGGGASLRQLSSYLHKHHSDHFMIYNLSEKVYDYSMLDQQVIEFRFPGYPAAPLNEVFALCNSIHAWLQADPQNVAVIHCQTGRGRTLCAIAWYLAWSGQLQTVQQAVMHCTSKMGVGPEIIIPTQQRYLDYLSAMLAGKKPTAAPMLLERVIMNGIPQLSGSASSGPSASGSPAHSASAGACRPYLQIFKDGQLLFTSTGRDSTELRWYTAADSCVLFPVGLQLEGDILVRVRHLDEKKKRISMLRFGLHTGFVAAGNTRLLKSQLDGAYNDPRFPRAFWIDLIFRPAEQPDPQSEEGQRQMEKQRLQQQYWEQVNSARRQTKSTVDLNAPPRRTTPAPAAAGDAAAVAGGDATPTAVASPADATAASSSPPVATSADSSASSKAKPSLGALFSSATSKLQLGLTGLSLFGAGDSAAGESGHGLDLSDPAVAKLHAADQEAMRKAKRRAATEAAVQAALQSPHARSGSQSATPVKPVPKPAGSDDSSFADLQRYVQGLSSVDAGDVEVNSDDEIGSSEQRSTQRQDEADLDRAMTQHFDSPDAGVAAAAPAVAKPATLSDDDIFASLAAETASNTAGAPSASTSAAAPSAASLDASDAASLEAELALLSAGDIDLGGDGDEDVLLDDADEAALLASLQDEMDGK